MKIAITGATGHLGKLVVNNLKTKISADNILALVRSTQKASTLGIEAREADYDKLETLENALAGIDTLLLISANEIGKRAAQHHNVIEAAKKTGVRWIVYTSILRADSSSIDLAEEHLITEKYMENSGISFTILRNGWYTENYTNSIPGAIAGGAFVGCAGEGKVSSASRADFADAAVAVLITKGHEGKIYELAGDEAWTLSDLAAEISHQTGKNIPYVNMSQAEYAATLVRNGLTEQMAQTIAGWDIAVSKGDLFDDGHQLSKLIGRPTTPLSITVDEELKGLKSE
jgi:NAD(P)H dehydrogenase (quinone)